MFHTQFFAEKNQWGIIDNNIEIHGINISLTFTHLYTVYRNKITLQKIDNNCTFWEKYSTAAHFNILAHILSVVDPELYSPVPPEIGS